MLILLFLGGNTYILNSIISKVLTSPPFGSFFAGKGGVFGIGGHKYWGAMPPNKIERASALLPSPPLPPPMIST